MDFKNCDILTRMNIETTITNPEARDFLDENAVSTPEHDAWVKAEIERRMAKKAKGDMAYRSLDDVMADFGFDAR